MKNIFKVYSRDIKNILNNPVALLIIVGLSFIPSLYAWVNIKACWNPYNNTSDIPVAVVNNDKGTTFKDKQINIGSGVVSNLKKNHNIGWKFVNAKTADLGVVDGTYYAVIKIPEDFSEKFTGFLSGNTEKPQITYEQNTKSNPVASKITEVAENTLVNQITSNFISTINSTIFSSLNEVGQAADKNRTNILTLKDDIITIDRNMDLITTALQSVNNNSTSLNLFLNELRSNMPSVNNSMNIILQSNESNKDLIEATQKSLNTSYDNIALNINSAEASANKIQDLANSLNSSASSTANTYVDSTINKINSESAALKSQISSITAYLQAINSSNPNADVANLISQLNSLQNSIDSESDNIKKLQQQYDDAHKLNNGLLSTVNTDIVSMNSKISSIKQQYNSSTKAALSKISNSLIASTNEASALIQNAQGLSEQIDKLLGTASDGTQLAAKLSGDLNSTLLQYRDVISQLSSKLQEVDNSDIAKIITILQSNPQFIGDFISTPFNIKEESLYQIPNYGSGMTPVYSVLSLWVGCLLLTSLLKTEVAYFEGIEGISLREKHFGKMLTFVTIAAIQGFIVSVGDKFLLGVYTKSPVLMILFAVFSSCTFAIITYNLVALLGNLGKAFSIVFMIIQLAGSGGTYPIQVDPLIFRILQPLFPFTYSLSGFREAIAGPLSSTVALDFFALFLFSLAFILFAFFFRRSVYEAIHIFETKFKESGVGE